MAGPLAAAAMIGEVVSALGALPRAIETLAGSFTGLASAVDPASVRVLGDALKSLSATIGFATIPAVTAFTGLVKGLAGELMEPMTALRDVVADLAGEGLAVVRPLVTMFGAAVRDAVTNLKLWMPAIKVVTASLEGVAQITGVVVRFFGVLANAITRPLIPFAGVADAATMVRDAMVDATVAVARWTATLLGLIGGPGLVKQFLEGLTPAKGAGRAAAYDNVQLGDVQSAYRQRLIEAGRATAGGQVNKEDAYRDKMLKLQEEMLENSEAQKKSAEEVRDFFKDVLRLIHAPTNWADRRLGRNDNEAPDKSPPPDRGGG